MITLKDFLNLYPIQYKCKLSFKEECIDKIILFIQCESRRYLEDTKNFKREFMDICDIVDATNENDIVGRLLLTPIFYAGNLYISFEINLYNSNDQILFRKSITRSFGGSIDANTLLPSAYTTYEMKKTLKSRIASIKKWLDKAKFTDLNLKI